MKDLQSALHRLPKINPSRRFCRFSKSRLMHRIQLHEDETWLVCLLKKIGIKTPSPSFVAQAKMRLTERIHGARRPLWGWFVFTKRLMASTLVMTIAVTATLFFVEGRQVASAAEKTYLEVIGGTASVKPADYLIWDEITGQTELMAGDLIRLPEGSSAVIHFFDDSELRLDEKSLVLINRLDVSPIYARQGIVEVFLHEGRAWVQTLNVDDGHAGFTIITRDAIVRALNNSFNVRTFLHQPTIVQAFNYTVDLQPLSPETREVTGHFKLTENQKAQIAVSQKNLAIISPISESDKVESWVQANLLADSQHLLALREREFNTLRQTTGTMPGHMLYPIKQAKERLKLAFSFDRERLTSTQIEIANQRLNEAIILLQEGKRQEAWQALIAYQSVAREIAEEAKHENKEKCKKVSKQMLTRHQKNLVASLPGDVPVVMVKEVLNQTEEMLAYDPLDKEKVRLKNAIKRLMSIADMTETGDFTAAKEALVNHKLTPISILEEAEKLADDGAKKELAQYILDMRQDELRLIKEIQHTIANYRLADSQLVSMINQAEEETSAHVQNTLVFIKPFLPPVSEVENIENLVDKNVQEFVDKVNIYKTWQGKKNQISRLFKANSRYNTDINFLRQVRDQLDVRSRNLINVRILELKGKARLLKHKAVKRKIDRAKRIRQK